MASRVMSTGKKQQDGGETERFGGLGTSEAASTQALQTPNEQNDATSEKANQICKMRQYRPGEKSRGEKEEKLDR